MLVNRYLRRDPLIRVPTVNRMPFPSLPKEDQVVHGSTGCAGCSSLLPSIFADSSWTSFSASFPCSLVQQLPVLAVAFRVPVSLVASTRIPSSGQRMWPSFDERWQRGCKIYDRDTRLHPPPPQLLGPLPHRRRAGEMDTRDSVSLPAHPRLRSGGTAGRWAVGQEQQAVRTSIRRSSQAQTRVIRVVIEVLIPSSRHHAHPSSILLPPPDSPPLPPRPASLTLVKNERIQPSDGPTVARGAGEHTHTRVNLNYLVT